jgi:phasin
MNTMSDQQSRKFSDKSTAVANEAVERGKAAAERSARTFGESYSTSVEHIRDYNRKMMEMAQANMEAVFEIARQLGSAKTPSEIIELWTTHARKQFEVLSEQTKELTALGQKMAIESVGPMARSINQTFNRAS